MDPQPQDRTGARIVLPAGRRYVRPLRLFTAGLLSCWDSDVELIEDAQVVASEACTLLWERHGERWTIEAEWSCVPGLLVLDVRLAEPSPNDEGPFQDPPVVDPPEMEGIGESILDVLTAWYHHQPEERRLVLHLSHQPAELEP